MKLRDNSTQIIKLYILLISVLLSGCNSLYFGTSSGIGVNVSGTGPLPSKIALAVDREEIALVPNKKDGQAHSVFGALDANIDWGNGQAIKQTFATGEAAINSAKAAAKMAADSGRGPANFAKEAASSAKKATSSAKNAAISAKNAAISAKNAAISAKNAAISARKADDFVKKGENKKLNRLYFGTRTTLGISISGSAGQASNEPFNMTMGYNRKEATIIPIDRSVDGEANSVYADISIVHSQQKNAAIALDIDLKDIPAKGVRISTKFATGEAAIALTREPTSPANIKLMKAAGLAQVLSQAQQEHEIRTEVTAMSKERFNSFASWLDKTFPENEIPKDGKGDPILDRFIDTTLPNISKTGGAAAIQTIYNYMKAVVSLAKEHSQAQQESYILEIIDDMSKAEFNSFVSWCQENISGCMINEDGNRKEGAILDHFKGDTLSNIRNRGGEAEVEKIYEYLKHKYGS